MQTHCRQDSNLHWAPVTGLSCQLDDYGFFGVMTSEYGEGNYSFIIPYINTFGYVDSFELPKVATGESNVFIYGNATENRTPLYIIIWYP